MCHFFFLVIRDILCIRTEDLLYLELGPVD